MKKILIGVLILTPFLTYSICINCSTTNDKPKFLHPIEKHKLTVEEPSGLAYDRSTNTLWTVSDETSKVYNVDLKGKILTKFSVNGKDLEGIAIVEDSIIVTILERSREVVLYKKNGTEIKRFQLNLKGKKNEGFEGITYNSKNKHLFIVNEKNPCLLIETDLNGKIISKKEITFAEDLSGLEYDSSKDELWMISDESKAIYKCKTDGSLISQYRIDIKQIEGIAFDFTNSKLFLVSDPLQQLYVFDIP